MKRYTVKYQGKSHGTHSLRDAARLATSLIVKHKVSMSDVTIEEIKEKKGTR